MSVLCIIVIEFTKHKIRSAYWQVGCLTLWTALDVRNLAGFRQIFSSRSIVRDGLGVPSFMVVVWNRFFRWGLPAHFRRVDCHNPAIAPRHPTVSNGSKRHRQHHSVRNRSRHQSRGNRVRRRKSADLNSHQQQPRATTDPDRLAA